MSPQKMAETRLALPLLGFSLLSIFRFGRVDSYTACSDSGVEGQGNAQQATKLVLGFARGKPNLQLLITLLYL